MSKSTQTETDIAFHQITVTDDYGIQFTGNSDSRQMRGDGSAKDTTPKPLPAIAVG